MTDSTTLNIPNLASMTNVSLSFCFQKRFIFVFLAHCNLVSDYCASWIAYSSSAWIPTHTICAAHCSNKGPPFPVITFPVPCPSLQRQLLPSISILSRNAREYNHGFAPGRCGVLGDKWRSEQGFVSSSIRSARINPRENVEGRSW
jgi:hypothetical protein